MKISALACFERNWLSFSKVVALQKQCAVYPWLRCCLQVDVLQGSVSTRTDFKESPMLPQNLPLTEGTT